MAIMGRYKGTGTKDRKLEPVPVMVAVCLLTIPAGHSDMPLETLKQLLRFGPAALPVRIADIDFAGRPGQWGPPADSSIDSVGAVV